MNPNNSKSEFQYGIPIKADEQIGEINQTEIIRNPKSIHALQKALSPEIITMKESIYHRCKNFPNHDFIGSRYQDTKTFNFRSIKECELLSKKLGMSILQENLSISQKDGSDIDLSIIGIYSKNREEWMIADISSILYGFILVPLYDSLGISSIRYILQNTNMKTLFCSKECLNLIKTEIILEQVKNIICFDKISEAEISEIIKKGYKYYYFWDLIAFCKSDDFNLPAIKPEYIFSIIFTSGTTGDPKGAVITHKGAVAIMTCLEGSGIILKENDS